MSRSASIALSASLSLAFLLVLSAGGPRGASAEIYRWTDSRGREHFTTNLGQVPAEYRGAAARSVNRPKPGQVNFVRGGSSTPVPSSPPPRGAPAPAAAAGAGAKPGGHDEIWWRAQYRIHAIKVETLERSVENCKGVNAPGGDPPAMDPHAEKRRQYDRNRAAVAACSQARLSLDTSRRRVTNFTEYARRSGVPPEWVR